MTPLKKFFIASTVILSGLLLFWGIYTLSFKKNQPQSEKNDYSLIADKQASQKKPTSQGAIIPVSDEPVISPVIVTHSSTIKYYSATDGQAYQMDIEGNNKQIISTKKLSGLTDIFWAPDKSKVVSQFKNSENLSIFYYYDYTTNLGTQLKEGLDNAIWFNNNKIAYKYYDAKDKSRTLNVADPDGSNWRKLTDIEFRNIKISTVPKSGFLSYWGIADAFNASPIVIVNSVDGTKKSFFGDKFGADYLWNPDGTNFLISHLDSKGGSKLVTGIASSQGGEYKNLNIPSMASKFAWSNDNKTLYYALPLNIPANAVIPNDYIQGKFKTSDSLWKIDTQNGEKKRLLELDKIPEGLDVSKIFLNDDESLLFFVNKSDGKLYRLNF